MTIERAVEILAENKKYAEDWAVSYRGLTGTRDEWQEDSIQAFDLAIRTLERMKNGGTDADT